MGWEAEDCGEMGGGFGEVGVFLVGVCFRVEGSGGRHGEGSRRKNATLELGLDAAYARS